MKTRTSFVSNSSSSSYIIAIKKEADKPCEKCGRRAHNIIDLIDRNNSDSDTSLESVDSFIESKEFDKKHLSETIYDLERGYEKYYKVKDIDRLKEEVKYIQNIIEKIKKSQNEQSVYAIRISYHDDTINNIFKQEVGRTIEIIVGDMND